MRSFDRVFKSVLVHVALLSFLCVSLFSCGGGAEHGDAVPIVSCTDTLVSDSFEVQKTVEKERIYGIELSDSLLFEYGKYPKNMPLGFLLAKYNISRKTVYELAEYAEGVFSVRKIKAGNPFCIFYKGDSVKTAVYFVYENTPTQCYVFSLADTVKVWEYEKKVQVKERFVEGVITSSLWNAMSDIDAPASLAFELSGIYAWTVDFFGLQKGDRFKVHYTENWVDTVFVGIDTIRSAEFTHCGTSILAIPFEQNGRMDYFDNDGNSLRKAFLKAPLKFSRISSHFSHSRLHPVLKIRRPHHGVDYAAPVGTPVMSIGDGRVVSKGYNKGGGHTVKVQHNSIYTTVYMHLSKYGKGIATGSYVKQGDIVGYVGSSGLSTGPHLDFRVYKNGKPIDPLKLESPSVAPVNEQDMDRFKSVRDSLVALMNSGILSSEK